MKNIIAFIILLLPMSCLAQFTVSGRVLNQPDTKPLANVSVFISNATIGTKTAEDGRFILQNIKPGNYELIISAIGYDIEKKNIVIEGNNIVLPDITIFPKTTSLNAITIVAAKSDPDRKRNLDLFKDTFLGTSDLAKECKILNSELLDLNYDDKSGILTASSVDFLIIENNALGYRIKYLLSNFMLNNQDERSRSFAYAGSVLFEQMKGTAGQQKEWQARRLQVYEGSQMHFLRAAINNRLEQEGFRVLMVPNNIQRPPDTLINEKIRVYSILKNDDKKYKDSLAYWTKKANLPKVTNKVIGYPLGKDDIINATNKRGLFSLGCSNDALYITYSKAHRFFPATVNGVSDASNTANTLVLFNEPYTYFDSNGAILNPLSLTYDGVWVRNRLAGLLPVDYEPKQTNTSITDSTLVNTIIHNLSRYNTGHLNEKVYLHFDKPYYTARDTMYFKAYATVGSSHLPNPLNEVLYVDIVGPGNNVQQSIKLQLLDGVAWGDFTLPDSLIQGKYSVRAYTKLMNDEDKNAVFNQSVSIGSVHNKLISSVDKTIKTAKPDIQFFPEGGSLTNGVRSKVAFKAVDTNGLSIGIKGIILDNDGKQITTFESTHSGMGYFYLEPKENNAYHAKVVYLNGGEDEVNLPVSSVRGINLEVNGLTRSYSVKITANKAFLQENKNKLYTLIVLSADSAQSLTCKLDKSEISLDVLKDDLHTGITKFTLFASTGEPLCERLVFVQNSDQLKIELKTSNRNYAPRGKVSVNLNAVDARGAFAKANFSVSVIDEDKIHLVENSESTIVNNLLFTSDIKGYVEQPNYYFSNINDKTAADLDLVMLTNGYRKFEWKAILNNKGISIDNKPEIGLQITGHVKKGEKTVNLAKVTLFTKDAGGLFYNTLTDIDGKFVFNNLAFKDTAKFVVRAVTEKNEDNVKVVLDKYIDTKVFVPANSNPVAISTDSLIGYTQRSQRFFNEKAKFGFNTVNELKSVTVKANRNAKDDLVHSQNLNGAGNADQVIGPKQLAKLDGYASLFDALRAVALFVDFNNDGRLVSKRTTKKVDGSAPDLMAIIVNGTYIEDFTFLKTIQTYDVESVEIMLGPAYGAVYGSRASGGAIVVTTKVGHKQIYNNYFPNVITYAANGFYKAREFYSPLYDNPKTNTAIPDLRSTIYWKPNIITDANGNATFEYFNADSKGTYRIVVEGIDINGNLGRQVYKYTVGNNL
ncbi:hypothetical protein FFF34_006525 [Inquilinus sp. KBS0705]|nr:hypothetical protein FFF34_006525 [Inquilinus sp. KBS0705]